MFIARATLAAVVVAGVALAAAAEPQPQQAVQCKLPGEEHTPLRIEAWGPNSVRVRIGADPSIEQKQQALLPRPPKLGADVRVATSAASCHLVSGNIKVRALPAQPRHHTPGSGSGSACSGSACSISLPGTSLSHVQTLEFEPHALTSLGWPDLAHLHPCHCVRSQLQHR